VTDEESPELQPDQQPDHLPDDPDTAWVRDLLADARVTDPVPADVVARLDEALASLTAERQAGRGGAPAAGQPGVVVPLRRRLGPLLVAAAAVVAVAGGGIGIAQLAGDDSNSSASSASADDRAQVEGVAPGASATRPPASVPESAPESAPKALKGASVAVPRLTSDAFAQDAARVMVSLADSSVTASLDSLAAGSAGASPSPAEASPSGGAAVQTPDQAYSAAPPVTATPPQAAADSADAPTCAGPVVTGAVTVRAFLDDTLVALVFRAPSATAQQVEAWSCDGATLLASASVPR